jgi:hypothetical protein
MGWGTLAVVAVEAAVSAYGAYSANQQAKKALKLDDTNLTSSSYGQGIVGVYGTMRVKGYYIWAENLKYQKAKKGTDPTTGGKGKKSGQQYLLSMNAAVCFGAGPATSIRRIWANGKVIYNAVGNTYSTYDYATDTTGGNILNNRVYRYHSGSYRFYLGTEDQLPDSLIQSDVDTRLGAGFTPAYRGLVYVVFEGLPLTDFGNSFPQFEAELANDVAAAPSYSAIGMGFTAQGITGWTPQTITFDPRPGRLYGISQELTRLVSFNRVSGQVVSTLSSTDPVMIAAVQQAIRHDGSLPPYTGTGIFFSRPIPDPNGTELWVCIDFNSRAIAVQLDGDTLSPMASCELGLLNHFSHGIAFGGWLITASSFGGQAVVLWSIPSLLAGSPAGVQAGAPGAFAAFGYDPAGGRVWAVTTSGTSSWVTEIITVGNTLPGATVEVPHFVAAMGWYDALLDQIILTDGSGNFLSVHASDMSAANTGYVPNVSSGPNLWANQFTLLGTLVCQSATALVRIDTRTFQVLQTWDFSSAAYITGYGTPFGVFGSTYEDLDNALWVLGGPAGALDAGPTKILLDRLDVAPNTVAAIVDGICRDAGIDGSQYDVTDLISLPITGYANPRPMPGRELLAPLMAAYRFDCAEIDGVLTFRRRGGASVRTIDQADLILDAQGNAPVIKETIKQEADLPMTATVRYSDPDQDYQPVTWTAERNASAVNMPNLKHASTRPMTHQGQNLMLDLPMSMDGATAGMLAQQALWDAWQKRTEVDFQVGPVNADLSPTDVITVTRINRTGMTGGTATEQALTITLEETELGASWAVRLKGTLNLATYDDSFSTVTQGAEPDSLRSNDVIPYESATSLWLANLPCLGIWDSDGAAWMLAAPSMSDGTTDWSGASIMRSATNGSDGWSVFRPYPGSSKVNWSRLTGLPSAAPNFASWDTTSTLVIRTMSNSVTFASATDLAVMNGANLLMVGSQASGWELIQYVTATKTAANTWTLSRLLRGRFGSEGNCGSHKVSDYVIPVSGLTPGMRVSDVSERTLQRYYQAISIGVDFLASPILPFTNTSAALMPLAVCQVANASDGSGGTVLSWVRRTRYAGELQDSTGDVPLNEVSEAYSVDVFTADGTRLLRTMAVSTPTVTYTLVDYNSDNATTATSVPILPYVIYQLSAVVGRGFPRSIIA